MPRYRVLTLKLPEDVYEELERRAREEGYPLPADYVRALIAEAISGTRGALSVKQLEERLRRLEEGELPPALQEKLLQLIRTALSEMIESGRIEVAGGTPIDVDEIVRKVAAKVEKKLMDLINPFTAKVDKVASSLADVVERLEALEEKVKQLEEKLGEVEKRAEEAAPTAHAAPQYRGGSEERLRGGTERYEHRRPRRSAIERLKQEGVVFESDLVWLRNKDTFFDKLRREGAIVLELAGERVGIDPDFWKQFLERLEKLDTSNEEEISVLLPENMYKLFRKLREAGLIYFDRSRKAWRLVSSLEKLTGGESES